jgi:hypothetical protein
MNALHAFLIFWNWFTTTHTCVAYFPDGGVGPQLTHNVVAYGGNCIQAISYAASLHGSVSWTGLTQGGINFAVGYGG